jgi:hypothetical protein
MTGRQALRSRLRQLLGAELGAPTQLLGIGKQVVSLVDKYTHDASEAGAWCGLLLALVGACPPAELPELLWLVETSMRHSPHL